MFSVADGFGFSKGHVKIGLMPFDDGLAERLMDCMPENPGLVETRMFGGFGYLLNGNMCVGIHNDTLIIRVGKDVADRLIAEEEGVGVMDLTTRVMKGWATIQPEAMEDDEELSRFVRYAIDFVETLPSKYE